MDFINQLLEGASKKIVDNGTRSDAGESMPGNALFLWEVKY